MNTVDAFSSIQGKTVDTIYFGNTNSIAAGDTLTFDAFKVGSGASYQIGNSTTFTRLLFSLSGIEVAGTLIVTATVDGDTVAQKTYKVADNDSLAQEMTFNNVAGKDVVISMENTNGAAAINANTFRALVQIGKVVPTVNC